MTSKLITLSTPGDDRLNVCRECYSAPRGAANAIPPSPTGERYSNVYHGERYVPGRTCESPNHGGLQTLYGFEARTRSRLWSMEAAGAQDRSNLFPTRAEADAELERLADALGCSVDDVRVVEVRS